MDLFKALGVYLALLLGFLHVSYIDSEALQVTKDNYAELISKNKLVFINFYADWCMFSQQLMPIFHQAADIIQQEYQNVKLGRVDCVVEQQIALENSVSKYPTIKLFRNGKPLLKEYRGERSVDAIISYIKAHMKPVVTDALEPVDLKIDETRSTFIGYFVAKNNVGYKTFERLANEVYESVDSIACIGDSFANNRAVGENLVFKPKKSSGENEVSYTGDLTNYEVLKQWLADKAHPIVREITFENAEELAEEGLPFLLLFHKPGDFTSIQRFKNGVMRELLGDRDNVNFLTADGTIFSHPLHNLGKSVNDLPVICLDDFKHMYPFKIFSDVDVPGKLKQFIDDLDSGKLHTDFHNSHPDLEQNVQQLFQLEIMQPGELEAQKEEKAVEVADGALKEAPPNKSEKKSGSGSGSGEKLVPPKTVFQKLAPSDNRYTLLNWGDYSGNYTDEL